MCICCGRFQCFDVYLRNDCFIIFIERLQLLVSQKNNVCERVCVCVCLYLICYFINAAYNLYVVVD